MRRASDYRIAPIFVERSHGAFRALSRERQKFCLQSDRKQRFIGARRLFVFREDDIMRGWLLGVKVLGLALFLGANQNAQEPPRKAFGLDKRVPWTTSKVIGSPEPPPPYRTELAFPKLPKFEEPLDLTYAPGTNRLFVAGRWGKIWSFVNKKDVDNADLALEFKVDKDSKGEPMKQVIYAFTFHPKFKDNGYIYVTWIPKPDKERRAKRLPRACRVSRSGESLPVIDLASEKIIFEWPNGGHNGGCIGNSVPTAFSTIVTGDGSGIARLPTTSVRTSPASTPSCSASTSIIRQPAKRTEFRWTIRSFSRLPSMARWFAPKSTLMGYVSCGVFSSFDRVTGDLWGEKRSRPGSVREMVYKIEKGGNYGWSVMEGTHDFLPERKKGPTPILKPVVEHSHADFRSITGGFVYHGKRLGELRGRYVYGDFDTGRVWTFRYFAMSELNGAKKEETLHIPGEHRELARTTYRIVRWGEDADGEIYFCDFTGGGIHQLVKAPPSR